MCLVEVAQNEEHVESNTDDIESGTSDTDTQRYLIHSQCIFRGSLSSMSVTYGKRKYEVISSKPVLDICQKLQYIPRI